MNKLIPILSLIVSAVCAAIAVIGVILVSVAVSVAQLALLAVPVAITACVLSALSTVFSGMFLRDKLCRIAFVIDACALVVSIVSIVMWLAVL